MSLVALHRGASSGEDRRACNGVEEIEVLDPATGEVVDVTEVRCGFDDVVDLSWRDVTRWTATELWTCPSCGTEHEDEIEADPDDERERRRGW